MNIIDEPIFDAEFDRAKVKTTQNPELADRIHRLLSQQSFCILCTQGQNQPYGSIISYAFTDDLKHIFFTTPVATRKFKLLSECNRIALVIDSRNQHQDDLSQIDAVTITGNATQISSGIIYENGIEMLKKRHPYLIDFLDSHTIALFQIDVVRYFHVTRFQDVSEWIP